MSRVRTFRPAAVLPLAALMLFAPGCGETPNHSAETQYTAESLAQELAFRFNTLSPSGRTAKRSRRPEKQAVSSKADELSPTKSQAKAATKKELAKTIDDVLDEIQGKISLVKGMSRADVITKMIDALSKETTLSDSDRQMLAGKLKEMGGG